MYVYNIIDVASGATLATFDTPQDALADVANHIGIKTRIVKAPRVETNVSADEDPVVAAKAASMAHIASKFEDGTYHRPHLLSPSDPWFTPESLETFERALGFTLSSIPEDMCIHQSTHDPYKVCYVRWNERGQPSITRVTYSRLLEILGSTAVASRDIGCFLREVNAKGPHIISSFRLHTHSDTIVDVYLHGPQSCMSHAKEYYEEGHPVSVYGNPDNNGTHSPLGVYTYNTGRWFSREDSDDDDDPREYFYTARTLVDHQAKIFSRLYGEHSEELAGYLRSIGYTRDGEDNRSFDLCGSWFCPEVLPTAGDRVYLKMPYVDNYTSGYYDVRDGRVYFADATERVPVSTQTTSGLTKPHGLQINTCLCCGDIYVAPSGREKTALEGLGWYTHACPACNNNGTAKQACEPVHVRTIAWYSLDDRKVETLEPLTLVELALISEDAYALVFDEGQLKIYTRPEYTPNSWEWLYPGVYWKTAVPFNSPTARAAITEYLLWSCGFLPPSWFDESFMWAHREDERNVFVENHGSRAKRYTTHGGLFVGYKSRWTATLRNPHWAPLHAFVSSSLRRLFSISVSGYFSALKEWQDANNHQ